MAVDVREELKRLATLFAPYATLYAVGGCVRDGLLGIECYDVDICSKLDVKDVKKILSNTDFVVSDKSLRMGTVHISRGNFCAEYTSFRQDSYERSSGAHKPLKVSFTDSILLDAKRRDFKCNAVYYDLLKDEIADPIGGVCDIRNKIVSTADDEDTVFEADGLRILRLVRFCAELGFKADAHTFDVAKQNAWRVKDIAVERIREELDKIFVADTRHPELGLKDAHVRGFRMLDELGLVDMLLPELAKLKGLQQPAKFHLYDAYEHSVKAFEVSPPRLRWASLLHDVGKARAVEINGNMHGHDEIGAEIARQMLNRLKFSNADRNRTVQLVRLHMTDINGNTSEAKLRRFVVEHMDVIDDLCALKDIDGIASAGKLTRPNRLRIAYETLKEQGVPLTVKDLKIDGRDLVDMGVSEKFRSGLLKDLLVETAMNPLLDDRERAIAFVEKHYKSILSQKE